MGARFAGTAALAARGGSRGVRSGPLERVVGRAAGDVAPPAPTAPRSGRGETLDSRPNFAPPAVTYLVDQPERAAGGQDKRLNPHGVR